MLMMFFPLSFLSIRKHLIRVTTVRVIPDMYSFTGFVIVSSGVFNFPKMFEFFVFVYILTQFFGGRYVRYSS